MSPVNYTSALLLANRRVGAEESGQTRVREVHNFVRPAISGNMSSSCDHKYVVLTCLCLCLSSATAADVY